MLAITNFEVTYGSSLAPNKFRKVSLDDGGLAELNRGICSTASFLWYSNQDDFLPIVEIVVIHNDEVPTGFEKLNRNILQGNGTAYVCFRRSSIEDPIYSIRVSYGDSDKGSNSLL